MRRWTPRGVHCICGVWFAPLPVVDGPYTKSEFMVVVDSDDTTYIASPFELPWLAAKALDFRRDEILAEPPSKLPQ